MNANNTSNQLSFIQKQFSANYKVEGLLGSGGMGGVYKAYQKKPPRWVALKIMQGASFATDRDRKRFVREAEAIAMLSHPGIVAVYEYGEVEETPYFTMEYVEGSELREYVKKERLDSKGICRLMLQVCEAVSYAHQRGVIHRDLKPGNIMVGKDDRSRVLDFGLARMASESERESKSLLTVSGELMGTPAYMSPEQTEGKPEEIDTRTDIYSLGIIFYELITGQLPYKIANLHPLQALKVIKEKKPVPPRSIRDIDKELELIVLKALEKDKGQRYQSVENLADDIENYLSGYAVKAHPPSTFYQIKRLIWHNRQVFIPVGVILLAILIAAGLFMRQITISYHEAQQAKKESETEEKRLLSLVTEMQNVRENVDKLISQDKWKEAYETAKLAEEIMPEEADLKGLGEEVVKKMEQSIVLLISQDKWKQAYETAKLAEEIMPEEADLKGLGEEVVKKMEQSIVLLISQDKLKEAHEKIQSAGSIMPEEAKVKQLAEEVRKKAISPLTETAEPVVYSGWPFKAEEAKSRQGKTATAMGIPVEKTNSIGMKLVLIPAGEFMMGSASSEEGRREDEGPQHKVRITKPFYIGKYEVTQSEYEAVMGKKPSRFKGANNPVEMVSWNDAVEFCRRLSKKEGVTYRLPTEAEWEYACRAGTGTAFHYGDSLSSMLANFNGSHPYGGARKGPDRRKTIPVESFKPNTWELYDMHGNVWEWCSDWYDEDYYSSSPVKDPNGPGSGARRVLRGGSWDNKGRFCRSAYRPRLVPTLRFNFFGFRVAQTPPEEAKVKQLAEEVRKKAISPLTETAEETVKMVKKEEVRLEASIAKPREPKPEPEKRKAKLDPALTARLFKAIGIQDVGAVKKLVANGADVNAKNKNGFPALYCAAYFRVWKMTEKQGAAGKKKAKEMVLILVENGARVNATTKHGWSVLHWAAREDYTDVIEVLIEKGADIDARDHQGFTPLHCAINSGNVDAGKLLIDRGANVNVQDNKGQTPLQLAEWQAKTYGYDEEVKKKSTVLAKYMREHGRK